jgi:hypothetical protein
MADDAVAWFESRTGSDDLHRKRYLPSFGLEYLMSTDTYSSIEICGNEQFVLGRDPELW